MFDKVQAARERLKGQANVTPVMTSRTLNRLLGAEVFLKCENLQRGGAFKFRGAFNTMSQLSDAQKRRGVITYSSGNHAQAVALVGQLLGIRTTVVMPHNAPATKRAATEGYGATVVGCEAAQREAAAHKLQEEQGGTIVPPFDHEEIVAGQGTATLEFMDEVGALDWLLVPVGGGGLISGSAIAAKASARAAGWLASNRNSATTRRARFTPRHCKRWRTAFPSRTARARGHWAASRCRSCCNTWMT